MYFEDCANLVREYPTLRATIEAIDAELSRLGIGRLILPSILSAKLEMAGCRVEQIPPVLAELVRKELLIQEDMLLCEECGTATEWSDSLREIRDDEPVECSDCGIELAIHNITRTTYYRLAKTCASVMSEATVASDTLGSISFMSGKERARPFHILHLSDLHFTADTVPQEVLFPLLSDIRDGEGGLGYDSIDGVIISGDLTDSAESLQFVKAREFVAGLLDQMSVERNSCIVVPGNHDVDWSVVGYQISAINKSDAANLPQDSYVIQGDTVLIRDEEEYKLRFKSFSESFYQPLFGVQYPLDALYQCKPHLMCGNRIQVLSANSSWQIDRWNKRRSGINQAALMTGLADARKQLIDEVVVLKLAVWHHPVTGNDKIVDVDFLAHLVKEGFSLCLHGDAHEHRADISNPLNEIRNIKIVGVGAFGASASARPQSTPRIYNMMEVDFGKRALRITSRCCNTEHGAWQPHCIWPGDSGSTRYSHYDIEF